MNPSHKRCFLLILVLAFAARAGWVGYRWAGQGPSLDYPDEQLHVELANNLVQEHTLVSADGRYAARMPLYPLFLAPFSALGPNGVLAARLAQALLGTLTVALVFLWARAALGPRPALLASALAAADPYAVFFCNLLLTEVLFTAIAVALAAVAWHLATTSSWPNRDRKGAGSPPLPNRDREGEGSPPVPNRDREGAGSPPPPNRDREGEGSPPVPNRDRKGAGPKLACGRGANPGTSPLPHGRGSECKVRSDGCGRPGGESAVAAVALLSTAAVFVRPSAFGWIILLWALLWCFDQYRRRATLRTLLYLAVALAALLPWGLRNRAVMGDFAWLSANGGITLYDAQGPQAAGDSNQAFMTEIPELRGLGEAQRDDLLRRLAIEQMQRDPHRVLELAGQKFLRTWSLAPNVTQYSGGTTALVSAAFMLVVLGLVLVGTVRIGRRWRLQTMLWLPVVYFTLLHCIFIGSLRYRVPLMPFLELAAGAAIVAQSSGTRSASNGMEFDAHDSPA